MTMQGARLAICLRDAAEWKSRETTAAAPANDHEISVLALRYFDYHLGGVARARAKLDFRCANLCRPFFRLVKQLVGEEFERFADIALDLAQLFQLLTRKVSANGEDAKFRASDLRQLSRSNDSAIRRARPISSHEDLPHCAFPKS